MPSPGLQVGAERENPAGPHDGGQLPSGARETSVLTIPHVGLGSADALETDESESDSRATASCDAGKSRPSDLGPFATSLDNVWQSGAPGGSANAS
jgi:hypothetical protein